MHPVRARERGGATGLGNLGPGRSTSAYGANQKDGLEDYLHQQVCDHGLSLAAAQHEIAVNWYAAWVAAGRPLPQDFGSATAPAPGPPPSPPAPAPAPWGSAAARRTPYSPELNGT